MKINFKHIDIRNFLSLGDNISLDLDNDGYTLISGRNNDARDNAASNGSGKSSILNAICWTLTGETINGLSQNIVNINSSGGCCCTLFFSIDKDNYEITRYREDKKFGNDLKIKINDEDKSGKGLRESQAILNQYLPDITSEFLGSVILLGQGMPHKFTANSPSGRKELLEKLSKSDFMIQDIKNRITSRLITLNADKNKLDLEISNLNVKKDMLNKQLNNSEYKLNNLDSVENLENNINKEKIELSSNTEMLAQLKQELEGIKNKKEESNIKYQTIVNYNAKETSDLKNRELQETNSYRTKIFEINAKIDSLKKEINKLESIKDICPTCGQKLINVVKPDTTQLHTELNNLNQEETETNNLLNNIKEKYYKENKELELTQLTISEDLKKELTSLTYKLREIESAIEIKNQNISRCNINISKYTETLNQLNIRKQEYVDTINNCKTTLKEIDSQLVYDTSDRNNLINREEAVKKMEVAVKRNFRGFLLLNVIQFINSKAKEYCREIFNTDLINVVLDGNNIDISYCGKEYENLSGGEKQRIDLIIQLSIRDMLCQYLNFSSNILALDEITDNLDELAVQNVLNLITNKLQDVASIYIISHHRDLCIPYDYEITVVKNDKGVSEIE